MQAQILTDLPAEAVQWLPYDIRYQGAELVVDWCSLAQAALTEPFFDQSIRRLLEQHPESARTSLAQAMNRLPSAQREGLPSGLIFHMSRCGSTLISQMLASAQAVSVFSEPALLEALLRNSYQPFGVQRETKRHLLKNVIRALLNYAPGGRASFIKLSARAILDYPLISQAVPAVSCIFVYREPLEVLISLLAGQADRLPPGLEKAGLLAEQAPFIRQLRPAEFWARVVARQCAAALEVATSSPLLLVNYSQLPEAVWTSIAQHFDFPVSAEDQEHMRAALLRKAKAPHERFEADGMRKHRAASGEIRALVDTWVRPTYERLESLRLQQDHPSKPGREPLQV